MGTENQRFVPGQGLRWVTQWWGQGAIMSSLLLWSLFFLLLCVSSEGLSSGEFDKFPCLMFLIWFGMSTCPEIPWFSLISWYIRYLSICALWWCQVDVGCLLVQSVESFYLGTWTQNGVDHGKLLLTKWSNSDLGTVWKLLVYTSKSN